jgi:3-hydroxyisobutyrate dehydrogenase-like beta-hydroxyacid dehydrogenase
LGFIGLGNMGYMMARNLANYLDASGAPALLVWNRSHGQSDKLVKELGGDKVRVAKSVEEIAQKSDILITSLPNDDVVKGIYGQIIDTLKVTFFRVSTNRIGVNVHVLIAPRRATLSMAEKE